jgi:hypothetical protein
LVSTALKSVTDVFCSLLFLLLLLDLDEVPAKKERQFCQSLSIFCAILFLLLSLWCQSLESARKVPRQSGWMDRCRRHFGKENKTLNVYIPDTTRREEEAR